MLIALFLGLVSRQVATHPLVGPTRFAATYRGSRRFAARRVACVLDCDRGVRDISIRRFAACTRTRTRSKDDWKPSDDDSQERMRILLLLHTCHRGRSRDGEQKAVEPRGRDSPREHFEHLLPSYQPSSALRSVLNVNQTVVEPAFIEKFELHGDLVVRWGITSGVSQTAIVSYIFRPKR